MREWWINRENIFASSTDSVYSGFSSEDMARKHRIGKQETVHVREVVASDTAQLTVVRAAIRDDRGAVWSLPKPARHNEVIAMMRKSGYGGPVHGDRQGFVLSDGRFARRKVALTVAHRANQIKRGETIGATLTSEDLW